jgi:hypothetical protein
MKPKIRIDFSDFWGNFRKCDNFFWNLLSKRFDLELSTDPDFLIYSNRLTHVHRVHNCVKIFFTPESYAPDWRECDYAFTCRYLDDPRHMRLPLYVVYGPPENLVRTGSENWEAVLASKKEFCAFVVGKGTRERPDRRAEFFHKLSRYKKVDSAGGFLNNMGSNVPYVGGAKVEFLRPYKFNIAFENAVVTGYTTEKIVEPMQARCLPVYRGSPRVNEEFNTASFLNYHDFAGDEALIEEIIALDRDEAKYLERLKQPNFINNQPNEFYDEERLLNQFEKIFSQPITPVSQRRPLFFFGRWILVKRNRPPLRKNASG